MCWAQTQRYWKIRGQFQQKASFKSGNQFGSAFYLLLEFLSVFTMDDIVAPVVYRMFSIQLDRY